MENFLILKIICIILFSLFTLIQCNSKQQQQQTTINQINHNNNNQNIQNNNDNNEDYGESGYCAPYNGKVCKAYISGQVWYSRADPNGGWKNEEITRALWDEMINDLTGLCRVAAEVST